MKILRDTKELVKIRSLKELIELNNKINNVRNDYWINEVIFSFNWWVLLLLTFIPWLLWWKAVDKKRLIEVLFYGSLISIYSILLDEIGTYFSLWIYQSQLVPISPRLNPIDLTVMPVTYMLAYQFFKKWRPFLICQLILAFGAAFIAEPLFIWLGIYKPINWELFYSFIIYFALGVFNKWSVERILKKQLAFT
jgi:hypothetical protein